jgi:hypothetical protein
MEWEDPKYILDLPYLDGSFFARALIFPVSRKPDGGLIRLLTCAGTHIVQGDFVGSKSPLHKTPEEFTLAYDPVDSPDDHRLIRSAMAKGRSVYFCYGGRCTDVFDATSGSTYTLTRPEALSIVPDGSLSVDFTTRVWLNDVEDASKATISGQSVTANGTGELVIDYTPVYSVLLEWGEQLRGKNFMAETINLTEVLGGTFD